MELVRAVLPDVHAVLGDSVGRPVRIKEESKGAALAWVASENPGDIHVQRTMLERRWQRGGVTDPAARDRNLTLVLAHELTHVYQLERHRWMRLARHSFLDDDYALSSVPAEGHASYVSNEVARRRGWSPLFHRGWQNEGVDFDLTDRGLRMTWFVRWVKVSAAGSLDEYGDGAAYVRALVEQFGHDQALRRLRNRRPRAESEILWPNDPDPDESVVRARLGELLAPTWSDLEIGRTTPRVLGALLGDPRFASSRLRGWRIVSNMLHEEWGATTMFLLPCPNARRVAAAGLESVQRLRAGRDLFGLRTSDTGAGFRAELLAGHDPLWRRELWLADGDWLVVLLGENNVGGPEWCEAWMRNALRIVRGDSDTRFRAAGWVARWQALWERIEPLRDDERGRMLSRYLEDPAEHLRALAWASLPGDEFDESEREQLCRRLRKERSLVVRMAARYDLVRDLVDETPAGSERRALVESILHDPDPFVRSGAYPEIDWFDADDDWNWYWRFALTDPEIWLRSDALNALDIGQLYRLVPESGLADPVPGRPTVEQCVREMVNDDWHADDALRLLIRVGSRDSSLWAHLLTQLRERRAAWMFEDDAVELLYRCPVPGGDRRQALEELLADEKLRAWAEAALALMDE
jgi:hypothetical protein